MWTSGDLEMYYYYVDRHSLMKKLKQMLRPKRQPWKPLVMWWLIGF